MSIEVYHWQIEHKVAKSPEAREIHFGLMRGKPEVITQILDEPHKWAMAGIRLQKVANVDADDLEGAWELTNHIESNWARGPRVTPAVSATNVRSSMVGDLMRKGDEVYVVAPMGFVKFDQEVDLDHACRAEAPAPAAGRRPGPH